MPTLIREEADERRGSRMLRPSPPHCEAEARRRRRKRKGRQRGRASGTAPVVAAVGVPMPMTVILLEGGTHGFCRWRLCVGFWTLEGRICAVVGPMLIWSRKEDFLEELGEITTKINSSIEYYNLSCLIGAFWNLRQTHESGTRSGQAHITYKSKRLPCGGQGFLYPVG